MPAYTENELARMRERAIASAREMQRRAAIKGGEQRQCRPPEPPKQQKPPAPPPKPPEKPKPPKNPPAPPIDDDRMLIIALIIILSADGADMLTIFALMYILM